MGSDNKKSEILGLDNTEENKDKEGELVALDYDIDTSKGERALKVNTISWFASCEMFLR